MEFYFVIKLYKNTGGPNSYRAFVTITDKDGDGAPLTYQQATNTVNAVKQEYETMGWKLMSAAIEMI